MIKRFLDFINLGESQNSLSRIYSHTENRHIGIVTAFRGEFSKSENLSRNARLASEVRSAGYGYNVYDGMYVETDKSGKKELKYEKSLFIIGPEGNDSGKFLSFMKQMGMKYEQEAVVWKPNTGKNAFLIGTSKNKGSFPPFGSVVNIGQWKANVTADIYTKMKGKRTFTFKESHIYKINFPNNLSRGYLASKKNYRIEHLDEKFFHELTDEDKNFIKIIKK